jgi:hypothetical protein
VVAKNGKIKESNVCQIMMYYQYGSNIIQNDCTREVPEAWACFSHDKQLLMVCISDMSIVHVFGLDERRAFHMPANEILARIGEDPARLVTLSELIDVLRKAGLPVSRSSIYKHQSLGTAMPYRIFGTRGIYNLGYAVDWAVARLRKPAGGVQKRTALNRKAVSADGERVAA